MREDLSTLIRRAELLATSFKQAVDTMAAHQDRLDRTPSIMPTPGFLSSGFSSSRMHPVYNVPRAHQGIDVVAPRGTPIVAPAAGRVVDVGRQTGYGKIVTLDHGNGVRTRYAHCEEILVKVGQRVTRGEEVATVGRTGVATNYHLHYEVLVNGHHVDPRTFIFGQVIVD
jgi:murein DD-endopeptidase MepM/ murein hydrolase activator NlpD